MNEITDGVFEVSSSLRFLGVRMLSRTTVMRLADGRLLVHSPGELSPKLQDELAAVGEVAALVAPNCFHHLWVSDWRAAYPAAHCYIAPSLEKKNKNLADATPLGDDVWKGDIEQMPIGGLPKIGETVFLHRSSKTLVVTDTLFNVRVAESWFAKMAWRSMGGWNRFGPTKLEKLLCKSKADLGRSMQRMLDWDFTRVVMAHGQVVEENAKDDIAKGYQWALRSV